MIEKKRTKRKKYNFLELEQCLVNNYSIKPQRLFSQQEQLKISIFELKKMEGMKHSNIQKKS